MSNIFSHHSGRHIKADYMEQIHPANQGNPFIEALPSRFSAEEFYDKLISSPPLDEKYLKLDVMDRLEFVHQIRPSFWLPMPSHYQKYVNLYSMIKIGYQSRNPMKAEYNKQFSLGLKEVFNAGIDSSGMNTAGIIHSAQSMSEIAINGLGKSQSYERMLTQLFPQVIYHSNYKGRTLPVTQVVWIKVECPYNKSAGAFCKSFFAEIDKVLGSGSHYYQKYGEKRGTIEDMVMRLIHVAYEVNLGLLVIDEIQKIHKAYSGGKDNIIDLLTQLINTIGLPVITLGSYKALYLFKDSLANSKRGIPIGFSENISGPMVKGGWEWNQFIQNLWEFQYTKKYTKRTPGLENAMYFYTKGIPDFVVKLFIHVQSKAILNGGDEKITISLIENVAKISFRLLLPIFNKMDSGDESAYGELEDVKPDWVQLNEYIKAADHRLAIFGGLAQEHSRALQQKNKDEILEKLMEFTLQLIQSPTDAEALVNQVYDASLGMADIGLMYNQLAQKIVEKNGQPVSESSPSTTSTSLPKQKPEKKVKPKMEANDIRLVVEQGYKRGMTTEEALEEKGYIRHMYELLDLIG